MAVAVSRFGMVDEDRRSVHPFFAPKNCKRNCCVINNRGDQRRLSGANPATAQEGFSARRQRQRTNSPVPREATFPKESINLSSHSTSQEWKNQLKAAASGEYLRPTRTTETFQIIETEPEKHVAVEPPIADSIILSETNGISTVLQVETFKPESSGYEKMPSASHKEEGMLILPQKMIGVCSGGKLVSPRSQSPAFKPTAKRKKGEIKSAEHIKQRIVKLRYGSTEKSHKILAQKIQEICSSIANRQSEIKEILKAPIAKPTHPFFLGGVGRIKDLTVACESATEQPVSCKVEKQHEMQRKEQHGSENAYSPKTALSNPKESGSLTDMSYKGRQSRSIRHAHAIEPVWPPKEMVHVRPLIHETAVSSAIKMEFPGLCGRRKLKYTKVHIADEEEILYPYSTLARAMCEENIKSKTTYEVNQPRRQVMTGSELQTVTGSLLACPMPTLQPVVIQQDSPANLHLTAKSSHGALLRLYNNIRSSSSAFDRFECETHDWIHKYSPQRAEEVLQSGREALVLRDWVKNLTVTSVGSGNSELFNGQSKSESSKRQDANSKRKKRKREEELDGFVISSDEEIVEMEELAWPEIREVDSNYTASGKRSVVRATQVSGNPAEGPRIANAVVISGPHGCGKTAAVYAVARELGFEVFEINSASRRSGKDILEKVGDMTKNHLVNQARAITGDEISKGVSNIAELLMTMGGSSSHGNVKAVSQPTAKVKKKRRGRPKIHAEPLDTNDVFEKKEKKQNQKQKQSLILLEEVDILFEEDRQFWSTTLDMILNSKRPVIMTCTDETLLPLHEMVLFAVLRFTPPPESLAIDYLILIASNEGHLLSRASVLGLLRSKHFDLRASITELNFSCQMAIGDTKGGLEWMLIQPSLTDNQTRTDENLRVVSVGTYQGDFNHGNCIQRNSELQCSVPKPISFLPEIWENWRVDDKCCGERRVTTPPSDRSEEKEECALQRLLTYERAVDAVSAADLHIFSENRRHDLVG